MSLAYGANRVENPNLTVPDGYSVGPFSKGFGTFDVFHGDKKIGGIDWHSKYYASFQAGKYEFKVSEYLEGENAQQKGLSLLVAFHKVVGDLELENGVRFYPNFFMNIFAMSSWCLTPILENIHFANVSRKVDGWHVEQLYGELTTTVYQSAQEAANAATEAAKTKGKTVKTVSSEMIMAEWFKSDREVKNKIDYVRWSEKPMVNGEEVNTSKKVLAGDVITWSGKTWTVK